MAETVWGGGLNAQRPPSVSWQPVFLAARGRQGAKLAGGDAQWRALDGPEPPEVLRTWERRRGGRQALRAGARDGSISAVH